MKQDMEILESQLRESRFIRIISNVADNGHDDDMPYEEYEDPDIVEVGQHASIRPIAGGNYQQFPQQVAYTDMGQVQQGYTGQHFA